MRRIEDHLGIIEKIGYTIKFMIIFTSIGINKNKKIKEVRLIVAAYRLILKGSKNGSFILNMRLSSGMETTISDMSMQNKDEMMPTRRLKCTILRITETMIPQIESANPKSIRYVRADAI